MNKIKLMYDIITTLKDKEGVNGNVKVEGTRDEVKVLDFENEFEKDAVTGQVKAKIRTEVNFGEHKMKHESTTELTMPCCHNKFHPMAGPMQCHHSHPIPGGFREKLNRLAFFLNILNNLQAEELEDGSVELSLDLTEIPEHLRTCMQEKMDHKMIQIHQEECGVIKELLVVENPEITLHARITPHREIERMVLNVGGEQRVEGGDVHVMNLRAELQLNW